MNLLHRLTAILSKAIIIVFMLCVVVLGAASSLVRYYTPKIGEYQTQILQQINQLSPNTKVFAGAIYGKWQPLQPELVLEDVSLQFSEHDEKVAIKEVSLTIDLFLSIVHRQLYFEAIEVAGLKLQLVQSKSGLWGLRSTAEDAAKKAQSKTHNQLQSAIRYLWHINNLQIQQVDIELAPYQQPKLKWPESSLSLIGSEQQKHWEVSIGKKPQQLLEGVFNSNGQPFTKGFQAKAYINLPTVDTLRYLPFLKEQFQLHSLQAGGQFWLKYQDGELQGDGTLNIKNLDLRGEQNLTMQSVATSFAFTANKHQQQLWLADTHINHSGSQFSVTALTLQKNDQQTQLFMPSLQLAKTSQFIQSLKLSEAANQALSTLNVQGELQNLLVQAPNAHLSDATVSATLKGGSSNVFKHVPGFAGVNGKLYAKMLSGEFVLSSKQFTLNLHNIFAKPLLLNNTGARVSWNINWDEKLLDLAVQDIAATHQSVARANGDLFLQVPLVPTPDQAGRLSLAIGFQGGDAKGREAFIPKLVPEGLNGWLAENILQGQVLAGSYIFHGPVTSNSEEQKVSQLWLNVDDAGLRFLPKWPSIDAIEGEFLLDGLDASIDVRKANSGNIALSDIAIKTESQRDTFSLAVAGKLAATGKDGINWLNNPGLNELLDIPWESVKPDKGAVEGSINSKITFKKDQEPLVELAVTSQLKNLELAVKPAKFTLKNIRGPVKFSLASGLQSKGLSMNIDGERLDISIFSNMLKQGMKTDVYFNARVNSERLAQVIDSPAFEFVRGGSQFSGKVSLSKNARSLAINSDLTGLEILLPEPYYKKAEDAQSFKLRTQLSAPSLFTEISLGKTLNADIRFTNNALDAAAINLGLGHSDLKKGRLIVTGQVPKANAQQWLEVATKLSQSPTPSSNPLQFIIEDLTVRHLQAYAFTLHNAGISLNKKRTAWVLNLNQQLIQGELEIPIANNQQYIADIRHLDLGLFQLLSNAENVASGEDAAVDLSALPDTAIHIRKLTFNKEDYGNWQFLLTSDNKQLKFEQLTGTVRHATIGPNASLNWQYQGKVPHTQFIGSISGKNMATVLSAWNYPQEIYSESFSFTADFTWPGGIDDFAITDTQGKLDIALNKGNFADAKSSGTDALKLISVLNLNNLLRRLKLDFSDLTQSGLSYDKIRGQVTLNKGLFNFSKPLHVKSSSSEMNLQGNINHLEQQLDLTLGVTLPFASNLPWIAALAAGLPTAIGVYIISKVMKKQVDTLSSALYSVSGSYSEPKLKFIRMFEKNSQ